MTEDAERDDVRDEDEAAEEEAEGDEEEEQGEDDVEEVEVEVAKYRITGLVHTYDEDGKVTGQLPIGSIQELPTVIGNEAVEQKRAELVE